MRRKVIYCPLSADASELDESTEPTHATASERIAWTTSERPKKKPDTKFFWLSALALVILSCLVPIATCGPKIEDNISHVPIGSKLTDLDELFVRRGGDPGEVTVWILTSEETDKDWEHCQQRVWTFQKVRAGQF